MAALEGPHEYTAGWMEGEETLELTGLGKPGERIGQFETVTTTLLLLHDWLVGCCICMNVTIPLLFPGERSDGVRAGPGEAIRAQPLLTGLRVSPLDSCSVSRNS